MDKHHCFPFRSLVDGLKLPAVHLGPDPGKSPSSAQLLTFSQINDHQASRLFHIRWMTKMLTNCPNWPNYTSVPPPFRDLNRTYLPKPCNLVYSSPTSVPYSLGRWKMVEAKGSTLAPFTTTEWPLGTLGVLMPLLPALNVRPLSLLRFKHRSPRARWLSSGQS